MAPSSGQRDWGYQEVRPECRAVLCFGYFSVCHIAAPGAAVCVIFLLQFLDFPILIHIAKIVTAGRNGNDGEGKEKTIMTYLSVSVILLNAYRSCQAPFSCFFLLRICS